MDASSPPSAPEARGLPIPRLAGRRALVTGGGQGLGQGIAIALARSGAMVAVAGRTARTLDATAALINTDDDVVATGGGAVAIVGDVRIADDCRRLVAETVDQLGGLDILVNNAVHGTLGPLLDASDDDLQAALETGPIAALRLMRAAHPHLAASRHGSIVNLVTSAAVRWDTSGFGVYAASKEALRSLGRTAASEWGADGIRVNNVAPHGLSPGLKWWTETYPEEAAEFVRTIPAGRIGDPLQDIGYAVAWLCSDEARYLSGATIPLDGGQARWA